MEIVSSGNACRAGRFREQRKPSAAILRIEKGPQQGKPLDGWKQITKG